MQCANQQKGGDMRQLSDAQTLKAEKMWREGHSLGEIAKAIGTSVYTLSPWIYSHDFAAAVAEPRVVGSARPAALCTINPAPGKEAGWLIQARSPTRARASADFENCGTARPPRGSTSSGRTLTRRARRRATCSI